MRKMIRQLTDELYLTYTRLLEAIAEIENPYNRHEFCDFCGRHMSAKHAVNCVYWLAVKRIHHEHAPSPDSKIIARVESFPLAMCPEPCVTYYKTIDQHGPLGQALNAQVVGELLALGDAVIVNRGNEQYLQIWLDAVCPICLSHLEGDGAHYCKGDEHANKS